MLEPEDLIEYLDGFYQRLPAFLGEEIADKTKYQIHLSKTPHKLIGTSIKYELMVVNDNGIGWKLLRDLNFTQDIMGKKRDILNTFLFVAMQIIQQINSIAVNRNVPDDKIFINIIRNNDAGIERGEYKYFVCIMQYNSENKPVPVLDSENKPMYNPLEYLLGKMEITE